jgi:hypothetical protein
MMVDSPSMNEPRQQESVPGSPLAHPALVGTLVDGNKDDDVLNVASHELRRSVSPEVADYVFKPKGERNFSGRNRSVRTDWTPERILNLPLDEVELRKLTGRNVDDLTNIGTNLWNLGAGQYFPYCARIFEVMLAWYNILNPKDGNLHLITAINLSIIYMGMGRITECEAILTKVIAENDVVCDGGITANRSRSLLGIIRSRQGQYASAERLSMEAMDSLRSLPGLAHHYTWRAHMATSMVLAEQGKFDARQRLSNRFYNDIHQTVSPQLLPSLRLLLGFCERCIEDWMSELKLQRLVRKSYLRDGQLGVRGRHSLTLQIVLRERWIRDATIGAVSEAAMDLKKSTGMEVELILASFASLVGLKVGSFRQLKSPNLRQEALKAVQDLKLTKFLVPIWIFWVSNETSLALETFDWKQAEQDLIYPLRAAEANHNTGAPQCSVLTGSGYPGSVSTMEDWCTDPQFGTSDRPESPLVLSTGAFRAASREASTDIPGFQSGTTMPYWGISPSLSIAPTGFPDPSASIRLPSLASRDQIPGLIHPASLSSNIGISSSQLLSPAQSRQLSDDRPYNWVSPIITFSQSLSPTQVLRPFTGVQAHNGFTQTLYLAEGRQPPDNAPPHHRFSPTIMDTATSAFTFSSPQSPRLSRVSPPRQSDQDSPAVAPSSVLAGLRGSSISPGLFGIHLSLFGLHLRSHQPRRRSFDPWR